MSVEKPQSQTYLTSVPDIFRQFGDALDDPAVREAQRKNLEFGGELPFTQDELFAIVQKLRLWGARMGIRWRSVEVKGDLPEGPDAAQAAYDAGERVLMPSIVERRESSGDA